MIRHACGVIVVSALCFSPISLVAQDKVITVTATTADVYKSPSTGSPIIGHVTRGTSLPVTRELGSWVKVSWPDAPDGVGYVHVTMGTVGAPPPVQPVQQPSARSGQSSAPSSVPADQRAAQPVARPVTTPVAAPPQSSAAAVAQASGGSASPAPARSASATQRTGARSVLVTPATHMLGVGALGATSGGGTLGLGPSARYWNRTRIGGQIALVRDSLSSDLVPSGAISWQFQPSVLYALPDHIADYVWLRPYVGGGVTVRHLSMSDLPFGTTASTSATDVSPLFFGGGEVTFPGLPKLGVSADAGYRGSRTTLAGVDVGGFGVAISGHWYIK